MVHRDDFIRGFRLLLGVDFQPLQDVHAVGRDDDIDAAARQFVKRLRHGHLPLRMQVGFRLVDEEESSLVENLPLN